MMRTQMVQTDAMFYKAYHDIVENLGALPYL